jgi:hypothetical protein
LATNGIDGSKADTLAHLQTIVNAYNAIVAAANGTAPVADTDIPALTAQQYANIGANIGAAASDPESLKLLNDAVGRKTAAGIDTVKEIENLARIANELQALVGTSPTPVTSSLTPAQLTELGITGVSDNNLASILTQLSKQTQPGATLDTLAELNALVSNTQAALNLIKDFAQDNTTSEALPDDGSSSQYTGDAGLNITVFANAGIVGVTAQNLRAIKDALATSAVTGAQADSKAKIEAIVNAYDAIRAAADGTLAALDADIPSLSKAQYAAIGVGNTTAGTATSLDINSLDDAKVLKLLNDAVGNRAVSHIDTVNEINNLGRIAKALQDVATGTDPSTLSPALTAADLTAMGLTGVTPANLPGVLKAIATGGGAGGGTGGEGMDTLQEIQAGIDATLAAVDDIRNFANDNSTSEALPDDNDPSQYIGHAGLTEADFTAAGVTGVNSSNLRSIQDALATSAVTGAKVQATADLQAVISRDRKSVV